jgi:molecular chaperone GrpE
MASKEGTTDDPIPIVRIEDVDIVDLASLLEDASATETRPSGKETAASYAAGLHSNANKAATEALAASLEGGELPPVPTLSEPPKPEETADPTGGNVFKVDLDGLDDFEALLQRTMGEAAGLGPAPNAPAASPSDVATPRQKAAKAVAATKWRKPARPIAAPEKKQTDEPSEHSKAIEELRKKVKAMNDETESYRRRLEEEAKAARGKGREDAFKTLMPIMDALEMALKSAGGSVNSAQLTEGIALVLKRLVTDLGQLGLEPISPEGETFDPNIHEAFQQVTTGNFAPGQVCEVVRKGYRFQDRLLRPAQVLVEKA